MIAVQNNPRVTLAGAGPGDPELITLKLRNRLMHAEVIITDRLVNPRVITDHARQDAVIIHAGKQGYNDASFTQDEINNLILEHAQAGKSVLRLKGGDTAFFSNILDELEVLHAAGIPYEIIPGITAASGASAFAGIPLTARGYANAVQFLAFNKGSHYSPERWKALASSSDTLVFYMASRNLPDLAELLLRYTRKPLMPIAVIEQASTEFQQVYISTLSACSQDFEGKEFSSPSLVIVGEVVSLHDKFKWYDPELDGSVFTPLQNAK